MKFNVSFEIVNDATGQVEVDDALLEEIAECADVDLEDMEDYEIWEMLTDRIPDYYCQARSDAYKNSGAGELGIVLYVETDR